MRTYTESATRPGNIIEADTLNREMAAFSSQLNGKLDAPTIPLEAITAAHLVEPSDTTSGITTGVVGASSAFYRTETRTSTITYDATDGTIVSGWNEVEVDFLLQFTAKAGMVLGSLVLCGQKMATDAASVEVGADAVWELRLLSNSQVIAQSGYIPVGTYTIDLPFCFPCGNESITIKAQIRQLNYIEPSLGWTHPELSVKDRMIWCRNAYR